MWMAQVRSVGWGEIQSYSDKWTGQQVRVRRTGGIKTIVHAQMLMGEQWKLDDGVWVTPSDVEVITE